MAPFEADRSVWDECRDVAFAGDDTDNQHVAVGLGAVQE
jgi:hypothetical protein